MSEHTDLYDTDYDEPFDDDLFDPAKTTDEQFLAAMQERYHSEEPAPVQVPVSQPAPQPTVPTSTKRALADLQTQAESIDKQIASVGGPAVELRAARLAVTEQVERLNDAITFGFDGKPDQVLTEMHGDAVLKLDEVQKAIRAMPAESMRSEADRVRLIRAERERDPLIAKGAALKREQGLRRDLKDFARVRAESIDARTRKAIEADRAKALNDKLAKARAEPDFEPWVGQAIVHEVTSVPITAQDLERKRKEIESQFDNEIADGIRKDRIRRVGGDPDADNRWRGFDVAR